MLCEQFQEGAQESGYGVVKINIRKKKISPCLACNACQQNHVCVQKDDMVEIIAEMKKADLSSPVRYISTLCPLR